MSFFHNIVNDLRQKRLWPIALVLLVALVAVPFLLSKSASTPTPTAPLPPASVPAPPATALPAVSVKTTQTKTRLIGHARNPFQQQAAPAPKTSTSTTTSNGTSATGSTPQHVSTPGMPSTGSSTGSSPSGGGGSSASGGSSSGGTSAPSGTSTSGTPSKPASSPSTLTDKQSYAVTLSVTNSSGGFDSVQPARLSVLPNERQQLLVQLGVLEGGHRVLFAVQPGTVVRGPGKCTPGTISCQILSLAPNQVETVGTSRGTAAQFAVTAIRTVQHPSAAAAHKARQASSATGRRLLSHSPLSALSLFQYRPSTGAVVDLSNLTVGGS